MLKILIIASVTLEIVPPSPHRRSSTASRPENHAPLVKKIFSWDSREVKLWQFNRILRTCAISSWMLCFLVF